MSNSVIKTQSSPLKTGQFWGLVINYAVGYLFLYPRIASIITLMIDPNAVVIHPAVALIVYAWTLGVTLFLGWPILKESIQHCPPFYKMIGNILFAFVMLYIVNAAGSIVASLLAGTQQSANQTEIILTFQQQPLMTLFLTVVFAPLVEELVFRGALYRHIRSKFGFIPSALISGLCFGMIHVYSSLLAGNFSDLWYLIAYAGLGMVFCYAYEENDTIIAPMTLHALNNGLAVLLLIIADFL